MARPKRNQTQCSHWSKIKKKGGLWEARRSIDTLSGTLKITQKLGRWKNSKLRRILTGRLNKLISLEEYYKKKEVLSGRMWVEMPVPETDSGCKWLSSQDIRGCWTEIEKKPTDCHCHYSQCVCKRGPKKLPTNLSRQNKKKIYI